MSGRRSFYLLVTDQLNCRLSIWSVNDSITQSATKRSKIFPKVRVNDIGRTYFVISVKTRVFCIGITSAFFHVVGTNDCCTDAFRIEAISNARVNAQDFNSLVH
jgi:hypothetical protein